MSMVSPSRCVAKLIPRPEHDKFDGSSHIIVSSHGCGEQSDRHWDAWTSGKPILTDRECDGVEPIPGLRLREGVHYLVYDDPEQIPDIVNDWTRPGRRDDLEQIARRGRLR